MKTTYNLKYRVQLKIGKTVHEITGQMVSCSKQAATQFGGSPQSWYVTLHAAGRESIKAKEATEARQGLVVAPLAWDAAKPKGQFESKVLSK